MHVLLLAPHYDKCGVGEALSTYKWVEGISGKLQSTVLTSHYKEWDACCSPTSAAETVNWIEPRLPRLFERFTREVYPGYPIYFARTRRWIKDRLEKGVRFDLVHQISPIALRYPSPAARLGIPLVMGPLGGSLPNPPGFKGEPTDRHWYRKIRVIDSVRWRFDPWLHRTYSESALILGVAPYVKELLCDVPIRRFEVASETGVDWIAERPRERDSATLPLKLLFVGRLIRTKGVIDAIRAVSQAARSCSVELTVLGEGEQIAACKEECQSLGIDDLVTFVGRVPRTEVDKWYARSDAFLFPSFREPSGNVVFEALSWGLPVITSTAGGPGFVVDNTCGLTVPTTEPRRYAVDLGKQIVRLATEPGLYSALSKGALNRMRKLALWGNKIDDLISLYRSIY